MFVRLFVVVFYIVSYRFEKDTVTVQESDGEVVINVLRDGFLGQYSQIGKFSQLIFHFSFCLDVRISFILQKSFQVIRKVFVLIFFIFKASEPAKSQN